MSDPVRFRIHIQRLGQIKERNNKYPTYTINAKGRNSPSPKSLKIQMLQKEISQNKVNISTIKKVFGKKKPIDYKIKGKYVYEKEVEKFQKQLINKLIKNNDVLKTEVKSLKDDNIFRKSKWETINVTFSIICDINTNQYDKYYSLISNIIIINNISIIIQYILIFYPKFIDKNNK